MPKQKPKTTLWTYPWDMLDAGPERSASGIAQTGLKSISLAATYHAFDQLRPGAKTNRLLQSAESAAYYPCNPEAFEPAAPAPQQGRLLTGEQWLSCTSAAKSEGLGVVAWTIFLHNSYLCRKYPELMQVTCLGDRLTHQLCPVQPRVRAYASALASDICGQEQVDTLECESLNFGGFGHTHFHPKHGVDLGPGGRFLFSLCFCDACEQEAHSANIDIRGIRDRASYGVGKSFTTGTPLSTSPSELVDGDQELSKFVALREDSVSELIHSVAAAAQKPIRVLAMGDRHISGLDVSAISQFVDSVEILCYSPDVNRIGRSIDEAISWTGSADLVGVGLQAYPPASLDAESLRRSVSKANEREVGVISFYNYGIMPTDGLQWITHALGKQS